MNKQYDCFIGCDNEYAEAKTIIFGAPFDSTTSFRPGTRFAPKAIRSESFGIETYSPYQDRDLNDIAVMDSGDIELPLGNTERVLEMIEERTSCILEDGKKPVMIGGEHLVTLGAVRSALRKYPDLHILHFDAHCDLRKDYLGERLSHATVIRRVWDILGDGRIYQLGIRSGERDEFEFGKKHTEMYKFNLKSIDEVIEKLQRKHVYFTLDLDVLDTSVFPGTGTPEAGGISFSELLSAILKLKKLNIVGCDMNELCPVFDGSGVSTAVACKILRELLLILTD
ncbi:MAG: agmatinase [Firmicutes bacterium HGW-Firmicutes-21]|nr:MAG: agmatinase [Firmicutes bacterium HGW-Firmicutes-21]